MLSVNKNEEEKYWRRISLYFEYIFWLDVTLTFVLPASSRSLADPHHAPHPRHPPPITISWASLIRRIHIRTNCFLDMAASFNYLTKFSWIFLCMLSRTWLSQVLIRKLVICVTFLDCFIKINFVWICTRMKREFL